MNVRRAVTVGRRVMRQLLRDRRTLAVLVMQPLLIMAIFGYAFGGEVHDARVSIANLDRGTLGQSLVQRLDPEKLDLRFAESEAAVEAAVLGREARAGVVVPANFTDNVKRGATGENRTAYLILFIDRTNPQLSAAVLEAVGDALTDALEDEFGRTGGVRFDERSVFGTEDERTLDFFVPGIAAFSIFMLGSMLTVVAIVKERTTGTLARVLASPARSGELVLGYSAAFGVFTTAQAAVVLSLASLVFRVPFRGSIVLALLVTAVLGMSALGLGILVSGLAENEFQAVQSVILVAFPSMFLAGVFAPVEAMPGFVRPLSRVIPLTYAVEALRDIINHGAAFGDVVPGLMVLGGFAAFFLMVAALTFGRKA